MKNYSLVLLGPVPSRHLQLWIWEMPPGKLMKMRILADLWYAFTSIHLHQTNNNCSLVYVTGNSEKYKESEREGQKGGDGKGKEG